MDFSNYLNTHRVKKGEYHTHTRIPDKVQNISGGIFNISNNSEFLESYHKFIKNGGKDYLTEKQLPDHNKRIVLDLDMRYSPEVTSRLHTTDHIIDFINCYITNLNKLINIQDKEINTYILHKSNVNRLGDKTKDGVHIIFNLCIHSDYQQYLRKVIIPDIKNLFDDLPLTNSIDDLIDEGIVKGSTNFQLIYSQKPNHEPYKVTDVIQWKFVKNTWDYKVINDDVDINMLSIRNTNIPVLIPDDVGILKKKVEKVEVEVEGEVEDSVEPPTYPRDLINKYIDGLPEEAYKCGEGNYAFNMFCALKKVGAKKCDIRRLMEKAKKDFCPLWFNTTWKQDTRAYSYDIEYIKSKSSYKEPPLFETGKCLIKLDELDQPKKMKEPKEPNIHDIIWDRFFIWVKKNKLLRIKNTTLIATRELEYYAKVLYETNEECLNSFIKEHQRLFQGSGLSAKRKNISTFLDFNQPHDNFPIKELDWKYFGYKDGLFDLIENRFIKCDFPKDVLCRNYFDEDYNPITELPDELREIYNTQKFTDETIDINLALLGRCFYKINTLEKWGVIMCNYGMSDTGKSTITETMTNALAICNRASVSLNEKGSNRFCLYKKDKSEIICITEAENIPNIWSADMIKNLSRGELTEIEGKGKDSYSTTWDTPIVMASNGVLKYKDKSNGVGNRIVYFEYANTPTEKKPELKDNLYKIIPRLIPFYVQKYFDLIKKGGAFKISEQMVSWRDAIDIEDDYFRTWLDMDNSDLYHQVIYEKGAETSANDIQEKFNNFVRFNIGKHEKHRISMANVEQLKLMKIDRKTIMSCKFCKKEHHKGCCEDYTRGARTSRTIYINCKIIDGGKNNYDNKYDNF
jgi:hypothetical protein